MVFQGFQVRIDQRPASTGITCPISQACGSMENTSLTARKACTSIADGFPILGFQRWLNGEEIVNLFSCDFLIVLFQCRSKASQHEVAPSVPSGHLSDVGGQRREGTGLSCWCKYCKPRAPGSVARGAHLAPHDEKEGEQGSRAPKAARAGWHGDPTGSIGAPAEVWASASTLGEPFCLGTGGPRCHAMWWLSSVSHQLSGGHRPGPPPWRSQR